ncbi:MAG: RNA polymerase sigma factor [Acidimicrobiales bacterium]
MSTKRSDETRLDAALTGDREAWQSIVSEYTDLLWWIARSYRLDTATAGDVVQTVWLQLVRRGDSIADASCLKSWLCTIARREAMRRAKTDGRESSLELVEDASDTTAPDVDEELLDSEEISIALAAFQTLGADCQRLLQLLCSDPPKSYQEIATLLGRTPGYIGPTRSRCLARLRAEMREMGLV